MHPVERFLVNSPVDYYFHKFFAAGPLLDWIAIGKPSRILELGCGVGITTRFIARAFPRAKITGLDYESQVALARRLNPGKNIDYQAGDATRLRFGRGSFDAVFEIMTFHHIPNWRRAAGEAFRVLRKDGRFVLMDVPLKGLHPFGLFHAFEPARFTKQEVIDALVKAGFIVEKRAGGMIISIQARKP
jgi:ubiquinone/menaquinone biosynthesis C-methylase UbiE